MTKRIVLLCLAYSLLLTSSVPAHGTDIAPWSANEKLAIHKVTTDKEVVGLYERLELDVDLSATYSNPFDPQEIEVIAYFTSPDGETFCQPGFFYQEFTRELADGRRERLHKKDSPCWKIRFAGTQPGIYKYYVEVRDRSGKVTSEVKSFKMVKSRNPGYIRRSKKNIHYLQFDSGKPYFAVGESIGWATSKQTYGYDYYFSKLANHKCNYTRIWMYPWHLCLEWSEQDKWTKGYGLGKYSLEEAWRFDYILRLAEQKGIYIMLTLGNYGDLMEEKGYWGEGRWSGNPYNQANGGPCAKPEEFWSNEKAREFYKKRLRYMIARWGYSTNLLSWEFFNEVNAPAGWVQEMAKFVKNADLSRHLVTISYCSPEISQIPEIDYTQTHLYGERGETLDLISHLVRHCIAQTNKYPKPHLVAEFGIDWSKSDVIHDKKGTGVNLHNGLWAATMSRCFGGAVNWWWDTYVEPKNLYYHYEALANFVENVNWTRGNWEIARTSVPEQKSSKRKKASFSDLVIPCTGGWGEREGEEFFVGNDETITGGIVNQFLHGPIKDDIRLTPVFHVNFPVAGKLILSIGTVSAGAILHVQLDGKEIWKKEFPTGPKGEGEWKKSEWKDEWKIYCCDYDSDYEINIPAGKHIIRMENTGKDWLVLKKLTLTNYKSSAYANARVIGLAREGECLLWIQNRESNWYANSQAREPGLLQSVTFDLLDMPDGKYQIQWWDTWKGEIVSRQNIRSKAGKILIEVPDFKRDLAAKIQKIWPF